MDEQRFRELERKRDTEGLSDEEADELGRMMAEKEGRGYGNARERPHPEVLDRDGRTPDSQSQFEEMKGHPDVQVDHAPEKG